eukprot:5356915-Amphidinium_carterae.1
MGSTGLHSLGSRCLGLLCDSFPAANQLAGTPVRAGSPDLCAHFAGCPDKRPSPLQNKAGSPNLILQCVFRAKKAVMAASVSWIR